MIKKKQYGFRKVRPTKTSFLNFTEELRWAVEGRNFFVRVFFVIKGVFEKVPHSIFLSKLDTLNQTCTSKSTEQLPENSMSLQVKNYQTSKESIEECLRILPQGHYVSKYSSMTYCNAFLTAILFFVQVTQIFRSSSKDLENFISKINFDVLSLSNWLIKMLTKA